MKHSTLALLVCLGAATSVWAQQGPNDIEMLKKYTGTWAVDCGKAAGTRLTVGTQSLALTSGGKQLKTGSPLTAFSYFGKQQPPAGFDVALLGEARPTGLTFLAMKDQIGPYLSIDADTPLEKQFGKAVLTGKFRQCP